MCWWAVVGWLGVEDEREYAGYLMYQPQRIMCISGNVAFQPHLGYILREKKVGPHMKNKFLKGKHNDVEMLSLQPQNANALQMSLST